MPDDATLDPALDAILDEQDRLAAAAAAAAAIAEAEAAEAAEAAEKARKPDHAAVLASLTDEEIAAARKATLLRQYAYVEGGPEEDPLARKEGPPRGGAKEEAEAKKAAEERRRLVEEALRLDGKKKKVRKALAGESRCGRRV